MSEVEVIDGEVVADPKREVAALAELSETNVPNLFGTDDPVAVIERAQRVATALMDVVETQNLYKVIGTKKHLLVEAWTLLGTMVGVFPVTEWARPITDSKGNPGYEARVRAVTRSGEIVGARETMCSKSESKWKNSDDYAIKSMAQTRAVSGALAGPLRFIAVLAGYAGTPEAEMTDDMVRREDVRTPDERALKPEEPPIPKSWAALAEALKEIHVDEVWVVQALEAGFGTAKTSELPQAQKDLAFQTMCTAYVRVHALMLADGQTATIGAPSFEQIREGFASVLDGLELAGPPTGEAA